MSEYTIIACLGAGKAIAPTIDALQDAYNHGTAGFFDVANIGGSLCIAFDRDVIEDLPELFGRLPTGWPLHEDDPIIRAACEQLAAEIEIRAACEQLAAEIEDAYGNESSGAVLKEIAASLREPAFCWVPNPWRLLQGVRSRQADWINA